MRVVWSLGQNRPFFPPSFIYLILCFLFLFLFKLRPLSTGVSSTVKTQQYPSQTIIDVIKFDSQKVTRREKREKNDSFCQSDAPGLCPKLHLFKKSDNRRSIGDVHLPCQVIIAIQANPSLSTLIVGEDEMAVTAVGYVHHPFVRVY